MFMRESRAMRIAAHWELGDRVVVRGHAEQITDMGRADLGVEESRACRY